MEKVDHYKRLFNFNHWANRESARVSTAISDQRPRALEILSHIVGAEQLWLDRLHGDASSIAVWPELHLADIQPALDKLHVQWDRFLDNQRADKLMRPIAYNNSKGQPWANRVEEILTHVIIHSAHHRGQLNLLVRDTGGEPPLVDFVHAVRTGLVE